MARFDRCLHQLTQSWTEPFGGHVYVDPYHQRLMFPESCLRGRVARLDGAALSALFPTSEPLVVVAINVTGDLPGPHLESMDGTITLDPDGWGPPGWSLRELRYSIHPHDMHWDVLSRYDAVCPSLGVAVSRTLVDRWVFYAGPGNPSFFDTLRDRD